MAGTIEGTSHKATVSPDYLPGYNTFYSIKLNRNNMRTSTFKFRLIDFEYIIPELLIRYPQSYLNDVSI